MNPVHFQQNVVPMQIGLIRPLEQPNPAIFRPQSIVQVPAIGAIMPPEQPRKPSLQQQSVQEQTVGVVIQPGIPAAQPMEPPSLESPIRVSLDPKTLKVRTYTPSQPIGESGHCCPECYAYLVAKKSTRRLPTCSTCHHYKGAPCHHSGDGSCLLLANQATCVDLSSCPSGHKSLHEVLDHKIAREIKNEHTLISKNFGTETFKDGKVSSTIAVQKFIEMLSDTQPERVESGRKNAERWYKTFGNRKDSNTEDEAPKAVKISKPDEDHDPYDLPEDVLEEKIKQAKKVEASAKRKREALESLLESRKKRRIYLSDDE